MAVAELSKHLYDFLPASGNMNTSFPLAAQKVGLGALWEHNSKLPALKNFLEKTLTADSVKLVPFVEEVFAQSLVWRGGDPDRCLTKSDLLELNRLLQNLEYRSPQLTDAKLINSLPDGSMAKSSSSSGNQFQRDIVPSNGVMSKLQGDLLEVSCKAPQERGFALERFLTKLFEAFEMAPRGSFRMTGEQIDGSFYFDNAHYNLEAKWTGGKTSQQDLLVFRGKVDGKATWSRGLFFSYNGYSSEGLEAFARGKPTNIICMDGYDLSVVLTGDISLQKLLRLKARRAAETNCCFVTARDLV